MAFRDNIGKVALKLQSERRIMGFVKTRRLMAQCVKAEGIPVDLGCHVDIRVAGEVDA